MSIKRITLKLYSKVCLSWIDTTYNRNVTPRPVRFERTLYEHEWPNLEAGNVPVGPSGAGTHTLHAGNHQLPFDVILPGNLDESVEGLEGGQVIYKLVATIERGRFANNLVAKRHLRVVRTLSPDALELNQTMSMENIWPNKIEYAISVPAKAIAVGSYTPVDFHMTPLLKGLKLGEIKTQLLEFKTLETPSGAFTQTENVVVHETTFPAPEEDSMLGEDEWKFSHDYFMPTSLSKCTQDCQIGSFIRVTHKLSFSVSLLNPDGHKSELRATLPICVFISPNVTITSLHPTVSHEFNDPISSARNSPKPSAGGEDQLFANAQNIQIGTHNTDRNNASANNYAPPNYDDHIYDTLWREIPAWQFESPLQSGTNTPFVRSRRNSFENAQEGGLALQDSSRLISNLYALQERQNREDGAGISSVLDRSHSAMQLSSSAASSQAAADLIAAASSQHNSRFSSRSTSGASTPREGGTPNNLLQMTPGVPGTDSSGHTPAGSHGLDYFNHRHSPEYAHLSHPASPLINSVPHTPPVGSLDLESLSRVPSYQTAINSSEALPDVYTPSYEEPQVQVPPAAAVGSSSLPRHLMASLGSKVNVHAGSVINSNGSNPAAFQRQKAGANSAISAPGSSAHISGLSKQIARSNLGSSDGSASGSNSNNSNANGASNSKSVPNTRIGSRSSSTNNLAGLNHGGHGSHGHGFFRTSSKAHLSSLVGLSSSNHSHSSSSSNIYGSHNGNNSSNNGSNPPPLNRNSSSRSLFDEASRFLHLHK